MLQKKQAEGRQAPPQTSVAQAQVPVDEASEGKHHDAGAAADADFATADWDE
jgi:hypothetical protein